MSELLMITWPCRQLNNLTHAGRSFEVSSSSVISSLRRKIMTRTDPSTSIPRKSVTTATNNLINSSSSSFSLVLYRRYAFGANNDATHLHVTRMC